MFPEFRDLMTHLKHKDQHFTHLFEMHNDLDQQIINMENQLTPGSHDEIEILKKKKLKVKDELFSYLKSVDAK